VGPVTHHTFCRICEASCGLRVEVERGAVTAIQPDPDHVGTAGYACLKGLLQHELYASPDRLSRPLKRVGNEHMEISWDQAMTEIGARVRAIHGERGGDALGMYVGTAAGFGVLHPIFAQGFMQGLGSRSMYSSATQDCANKFSVATEMYGFPFVQPFPDVDRTECLIVVGANPAVSKWSFLQVPNPIRRLKQIEQRGGRVFFVDPRRTESAKVAGEHVFIRPGTDVFFYLSFLREVLQRGFVNEAHVARSMTGLDALRALCEPWSAQRTELVTGISAATLGHMVDAYVTADGAALYSSTGVNMGGQGALSFWLEQAINAVTGNLDRAGGTLVGEGLFDFPRFGKRTGALLGRAKSRIGGFGQVNDAFPGGILADEIETPGPGQLRALFVTGGNPLMTMPNSAHLSRALGELELLVCLDIQLGETASLAHYVLPCTSPLERPDLPFLFPLLLGMQSRPHLTATRAVLPAHGEARDEASLYLSLARASGLPLWGSRIAQRAMEALAHAHTRRRGLRHFTLPQERLLSALLRATGQGSFAALLRHQHGRLRAPHRPGSFLGGRVVTDDGKVNLAPAMLMNAAHSLERTFADELASSGKLRLITRRALTTHNSWTHNVARFVDAHGGTNVLYMHPDDARRAGLADGDLVDVKTKVGQVRLPMRTLADLMPGVVALPHGWGHQHAKGLRVAQRTRGVNVNLLAADGADALERSSGMARLTAIEVEVSRATGPQDSTSWSGLPAVS